MGYNIGQNHYMAPQISGYESIAHYSEKTANRIKTGAAMAGVGAVGLTGACIANSVKSNATTLSETFAQTFPKITNGLKTIYKYSGIPYVKDKATNFLQKNKTINGAKSKISNIAVKTKDFTLNKLKLTNIVNYFKKDGTIGNKIKTSLGSLTDTLKNGWKNMSAKNKLIAAIGLATIGAMTAIWGKGKYEDGKIDQKYEDRAKFN